MCFRNAHLGALLTRVPIQDTKRGYSGRVTVMRSLGEARGGIVSMYPSKSFRAGQ